MAEEKDRERKTRKEEEQVEKLVKPSPKKKPPRTDRENRRMKVEDADVSKKDKDLSMNFKDIGGSHHRVLLRYLNAFSYTPLSELAQDNPEDFEAPILSEEELLEQALELYSKPTDDVIEIMIADPSLKPVAEKALVLKMSPLPPGWEMDDVFVDARIQLKDRHRLRKHMEQWDALAFARNLNYFQERYLNETLTSSRQDREDYFQSLIHMVQQGYEEFQHQEALPLTNLADAVATLQDPEGQYDPQVDLSEIEDIWRARLRRTATEHLDALKDEIELALRGEIGKDTNLHYWLMKLRSLIAGARVMQQKVDPQTLVAAIKSGMSKEAQYRGVSGYEPRELLPDAPKWSRPDPYELRAEDYSRLLLNAVEWLNSDFLRPDLLVLNPEMARRIALDYAIYDFEEGKYQSRIDAPTYDRMLGIFRRVMETE